MTMQPRFHKQIVIATLAVLSLVGTAVYATHAWGNYHWARQTNPFTLKLGDNVSTAWDSSLVLASSDWSQSSVLDSPVVTGSTNPKNCRPVSGRVEVCNNRYGNNGWLGIASIWATGDHITQGTVKVNDTYFSTVKYNTAEWRNFVMCQEIGHTFGLDHQDENFDNTPLGTCMDYTSDPTPNQHPNQHDYDQLEAIYSHLDSFTTLSQSLFSSPRNFGQAENAQPAEEADWGKAIRHSANGRTSLYERDLGAGRKIFTFIIWAD